MTSIENQLAMYSQLSNDEIEYPIDTKGREWVQPTNYIDWDHKIKVGNRFPVGGAKHIRLMELLPEIFTPIPHLMKQRTKKGKFPLRQVSLAKMREIGFNTRSEMREFIKANKVTTPNELYEARAGAEPVLLKKEYLSKVTLPKMRKLGFKNREELRRYIKDHKVRTLAQLETMRAGIKPVITDITIAYRKEQWRALGFVNRIQWNEFRRHIKTMINRERSRNILMIPEALATAAKRYLTPFHITGYKETGRLYEGLRIAFIIKHEGIAADYEKYCKELATVCAGVIHDEQGSPRRPCQFNIAMAAVTLRIVNDREVHNLPDEIIAIYVALENGDFALIKSIVDECDEETVKPWLRKRAYFRGGNAMSVRGDEAEEKVEEQRSNMISEIDRMEGHVGSGWIFLYATHSYLNFYEQEFLTGSSYIDLPDWLKNKKACINPMNKEDQLCALHSAIIAKHHPKLGTHPEPLGEYPRKLQTRHRELVTQYQAHPKYRESLFPLTLERRSINTLEEIMELNLWVWVVDQKRQTFVPTSKSPCKYSTDVLLLYIKDGDNGHYVWANNPSRLVNAHTASQTNVSYVCFNCTNYKSTPKALEEHVRCCIHNESAVNVMGSAAGRQMKKESAEEYEQRKIKAGPPKLTFKSHHALLDVPAYILFDGEATNHLAMADIADSEDSTPAQKEAATKLIATQPLNSARIVVVDTTTDKIWHTESYYECVECFYGEPCERATACGKKCEPAVRQLIQGIKHWGRQIYNRFLKVSAAKPVDKSDEVAMARFKMATHCCICEKKLMKMKCEKCNPKKACKCKSVDKRKVLHHNHHTGKIIGAAHSSCNLKVKKMRNIPCLAHNFGNYDSHHIMEGMQWSDFDKISALPCNSQKVKNLSWKYEATDEMEHVDPLTLKFKVLSRDEMIVQGPDGQKLQGKEIFFAVVKNINAYHRNKLRNYQIDFKDSYSFLQSSLDTAAASMNDKDFHAVRNYSNEICGTKDRLRKFLEDRAITTRDCIDRSAEEKADFEQRHSVTFWIMDLFGWATKEIKKAGNDKEKLKAAYDLQSDKYIEFIADPDPVEFTFRLNRRKGVYAYEWFDDIRKWNATSLPPIETFISKLQHNVSGLSELQEKQRKELRKNYLTAQMVWAWYGFKTFRAYHEHYLALDCFLLTDVMQHYRKSFRQGYGLDPLHFATLPSAALAAVLRKTKVNCDLMGPLDMDKYLFFEDNGIRGGVSTLGTIRHATANNPELPSTYDPKKPTRYICYVDYKSMYATVMRYLLPHGGYLWLDDIDEFKQEYMHIDVEGPKGYWAEIKTHCPRCWTLLPEKTETERMIKREHLCAGKQEHPEDCTCIHDLQADYPCFPENMQATYSEMSEKQQGQATKQPTLTNPDPKGDTKLMPNLKPKEFYKCHLKTLQLAVRLGWVVDEIHRVMQFDQKAWIKPYIDYNGDMRQKARDVGDDFGTGFFKLMSNIIFGKTIEDVRKYSKMDIVRTKGEKELCAKRIKDTHFVDAVDINDGMIAVMRKNKRVKLDKPIAVGASVLELAKYEMQNWYYNVLKRKYGDKVQMLYTDTDSFILVFTAPPGEGFDIYRDIKEDPALTRTFDLSNFPKDYVTNTGVRMYEPCTEEQVMGVMKFEHVIPIKDAVALRSKMYSILLGDKTEQDSMNKELHKQTAKGVDKKIMGSILHLHYLHALYTGEKLRKVWYTLRSRNHTIRLEQLSKIAISSFNDKNYECPDGSMLPWGHARIEKFSQ